MRGGQGAPHAQPGGEDGGVTSAEAPHAAPVASSVRPCVSACADPRSCFLLGGRPNPVLDSLTHAPTPAGVFLLPAAVPNLTRTRVCVRLCRKSRKSGSLLPRCRLSAS